jgi:ribonucleoside-diphosphate reductase alpha chain
MTQPDVSNNGRVLPTPSLPNNLPQVDLSENSYQVLTRRYIRKGDQGELSETPEELFWRVAYHVAKVEEKWDADIHSCASDYYKLLANKRFLPNSPTFTGAGTPLGQLAACFVLPISDDMGRRSDGIFQTLRDAALIQQTGGGNGFAFSSLRPSGAIVKASSGKATGPIGFLRVYDNAFGEVAQGGTRRGANMAVLRIDHPNIEEFIQCKTNENAITNFNISVGITDAFMQAVENDAPWDLRFPDVHHPSYREFSGTIEDAEEAGIPILKHRTVNARELFNLIVRQAHHNGEPGLLFLDAANRSNPLPHLYRLQSTNPCGEQWLGPYENCCLGSINLSKYFIDGDGVLWQKLAEDVHLATRFLDDVVDANAYVPAVPQLKESAMGARRLGLGIMGLADIMFSNNVRYGSPQGQAFAAQIIEFVRYHAMQESIQLAKSRGPFPAISGSIYDPKDLKWQSPQKIESFDSDFGRPALDWTKIEQGIKKFGVRNAAQTTIAPTGTIGTVAGCEGYGCEPVFALAYTRRVDDHGQDLNLTYASPLFEKALINADLDKKQRQVIIEKVMAAGSCQGIEEIPEEIRRVFVVSMDISAEEHVQMQSALQTYVDNSISKTINFPREARVEDIASAYLSAWKQGCKGITVYVTGSREQEVLQTHSHPAKNKPELATTDIPEVGGPIWIKESDAEESLFAPRTKKPRPRFLPGFTFGVETPVGKTFVTVNENGNSQPFEVFINTAKAGSDVAADGEAIGRLISYILRLSSPIEPSVRIQEVWRQLSGLGGGRPMGFGPNRVRSLPDGLAQVLAEYIESRSDRISQVTSPSVDQLMEGEKPTPTDIGEQVDWLKKCEMSPMQIGDHCPECGQAALINEEGCRKCYACGYSEC